MDVRYRQGDAAGDEKITEDDIMKLTIIGAGNMGGATALGLVNGGKLSPEDICVTAAHQQTLVKFASRGIRTSLDNQDAVEGADVVVIAVKPWLVEDVVKEMAPCLDGNKVLVNFAAGIDGNHILGLLGQGSNMPDLLNVIPNTAIEIGRSMTFIQPVKASPESLSIVKELFNAVGEIMVVNPKGLSAGMALSSCGIAYAMRYIHAAASGGVELGMYPRDAVKTVCQTVIGAAELIFEHGSHPETEIDKVTTPGGITIKGLNEMEHAGFTSAVVRGLKASKP